MATWWRRMFGRQTQPPAIPAPSPEPQHLGSEEEVFLGQLVQDLADGKRRGEIASPEVLAKLDGLWKAGHERLAIEWTEKLLNVPEVPADTVAPLRAALVERYEQRGELDTAVPHLELLVNSEPYGLRAHYLLAEHARKKGDHERALRHYEAVLGRDVDYPNVRVRVDRLRQLTGRSAPVAGETIAAGEVAGIQAGARYRLMRELGRGATGVVYLARDAELDRDVAVKLLHPHLAGSDKAESLARFFHEARVMASLRHPNVVAVLDMDEASRRIVIALAAAHRRGIIHCDLKPANLMFRRDADLPGVEVMLGDFGVAHLPDASGQAAAVSRRAEAVGTLAYMSPEQRRGELSPAADVYASAVVLFEMLTAQMPGSREGVIGGRRAANDFRLPNEIFASAPGVAAEVQNHINRLSDPDPTKRPTTAQALAESQRLRERVIAAGAA